MNLNELYANRFNAKTWKKRNSMWRILCEDFFNKYVDPHDDVLDLAAGYCDFINNIAVSENMGRRIAVDLNPDVKFHAQKFVEIHNTPAQNLNFLEDETIDKIFVSNFFEHIKDKEDILRILTECLRVLKTGGKLMILQPNIKYLPGEYWDFFDHYTPLTEQSMQEAISIITYGGGGHFKINQVIKKFLPYTTKSKIPQFNFLIKIYCHCPLIWQIMGKQMFIVAEKKRR